MESVQVVLGDPFKSFKGDAKLLRGRIAGYRKRACKVSVIYITIGLAESGISRIEESDELGLYRCNVNIGDFISKVLVILGLRGVPFQCQASWIIKACIGEELKNFLQRFEVVHFYHIRCVGLYGLVTSGQGLICDLIDSYTLNIRSKLKYQNPLLRLVWSEELRRIIRLEQTLEMYTERAVSCVLTVSRRDAEYIRHRRKYVIPVGVETNSVKDVRTGEDLINGFTSCIFFGNLDYDPNRRAIEFILRAVRYFNAKGGEFGRKIRVTIAGRNASLRQRLSCLLKGVKIVSPVRDMEALVRRHEVSIVPIFSGSGMQSKVLESIAWQLPIVGSKVATEVLGLEDEADYLECKDEESMAIQILRIARGEVDKNLLVNNALKKIEGISWEETTLELDRIYSSLVGRVE